MAQAAQARRPKEAARCRIEGCWEPAVIVNLCRNCYANLRYWLSGEKTVADLMERQRRVHRYAQRMDHFVGTARTKGRKIVPFRKGAEQA